MSSVASVSSRYAVHLEIPSDAPGGGVARLIAADAGLAAGLDADEIDDLRIAVDELREALGRAAGRPSPATRVALEFEVGDALVRVQAAMPLASSGEPIDGASELAPVSALTRRVLEVVTAEYEAPYVGDRSIRASVTKRAVGRRA